MEKATKYILGVLVLLLFFLWAEIVRSPSDNNVHIYFFNVGQGDSILIEKGSYQILIDGGPDDSLLSRLGKSMPISDRKIETVILTHPHSDHLRGIDLVLDCYEVGEVYSTGVLHTSNTHLEFLEKIKEKNIVYKIPKIGESITPYENAKLEFLWPGEKYNGQTVENLNNTSEVSRFCYYSECVFLPGDLEIDGQNEMFGKSEKENIEIKSDLLKIPHHGSINANGEILYDKIIPTYAVISVGADNKFGHPHIKTLDILEKKGIRPYRTDRDGTIEFILKENEIVKN